MVDASIAGEVRLGSRILYRGVEGEDVFEGILGEVETVGGLEFAKVMNVMVGMELWIQRDRIIGALPDDEEDTPKLVVGPGGE